MERAERGGCMIVVSDTTPLISLRKFNHLVEFDDELNMLGNVKVSSEKSDLSMAQKIPILQ